MQKIRIWLNLPPFINIFLFDHLVVKVLVLFENFFQVFIFVSDLKLLRLLLVSLLGIVL